MMALLPLFLPAGHNWTFHLYPFPTLYLSASIKEGVEGVGGVISSMGHGRVVSSCIVKVLHKVDAFVLEVACVYTTLPKTS